MREFKEMFNTVATVAGLVLAIGAFSVLGNGFENSTVTQKKPQGEVASLSVLSIGGYFNQKSFQNGDSHSSCTSLSKDCTLGITNQDKPVYDGLARQMGKN